MTSVLLYFVAISALTTSLPIQLFMSGLNILSWIITSHWECILTGTHVAWWVKLVHFLGVEIGSCVLLCNCDCSSDFDMTKSHVQIQGIFPVRVHASSPSRKFQQPQDTWTGKSHRLSKTCGPAPQQIFLTRSKCDLWAFQLSLTVINYH